MDQEQFSKKKAVDHHKQLNLCTTRPHYRQGRKLTAVKVYTVNSESQHLFIYGVPVINLRQELKNLCSRYGQLKAIHVVEGYETEAFTECFHVQYERIQSARVARRLMDNKSFYGSCLHVCYAPEYETVAETRAKLKQRTRDVTNRIYKNLQGCANFGESDGASKNKNKRKKTYYSSFVEASDSKKVKV